jgi:hypothetical protein
MNAATGDRRQFLRRFQNAVYSLCLGATTSVCVIVSMLVWQDQETSTTQRIATIGTIASSGALIVGFGAGAVALQTWNYTTGLPVLALQVALGTSGFNAPTILVDRNADGGWEGDLPVDQLGLNLRVRNSGRYPAVAPSVLLQCRGFEVWIDHVPEGWTIVDERPGGGVRAIQWDAAGMVVHADSTRQLPNMAVSRLLIDSLDGASIHVSVYASGGFSRRVEIPLRTLRRDAVAEGPRLKMIDDWLAL